VYGFRRKQKRLDVSEQCLVFVEDELNVDVEKEEEEEEERTARALL
jgi:hypothetical protein